MTGNAGDRANQPRLLRRRRLTDICLECDQVKLTIKVPEKLTVTPKQIMAFLYAPEADGKWIFPPMRPPDGGTQENQVIDPVIDVDKPHTMICHGLLLLPGEMPLR